jgi:epoxyqueuosine reductase
MKISATIMKQTAQHCGFALCGIAKSETLTLEKKRFEKALAQNLHAKKEYLERDIEKRFTPELLLENCKSVIVCGFNYNAQKAESRKQKACRGVTCYAQDDHFKISQYAQIKDYHIFMKEKLEALAKGLQEQYGDFNYKTAIDSSAISEKAWAVQAGIGYYGKNGIIQTQVGSFVFLGILLIDKEVNEYDNPNPNSCGNCGKCMATCPTQAIVAPFCVDCNRCITNLVQNKKEIDFTRVAKYGWLIACDECQNICPNNAHAPVNEEAVALQASFVKNSKEILENLTPELFEQYFKDTIIYQFKYEGIKKRVEDFS